MGAVYNLHPVKKIRAIPDTGKIIEQLKKVLDISERNNIYYKIKLQLGKCYLQDGKFEKAKEVVEELLASVDLPAHDPGSRLASDAKILLSSLQSY